MIKFLKKEIEWVDTQLDKCVAQVHEWKRTSQILHSGHRYRRCVYPIRWISELRLLSNKKI